MRIPFFSIFILLIFFAGIVSCKKNKDNQLHACFNTEYKEVEIGQVDSFYNCSQNAYSYKWYFGDGDSGIMDTTAAHVYASPGVYTVKLLAFDLHSNQSSDTDHIVVTLPSVYSQAYTSTYSGNEVCSLTGADTMSIAITANGYLGLNISNLYGSGKSFYATVDSLNGVIAPQNFSTGSGNAVLQGTFSLSSNLDSLSFSLVVTTFGQRNTCSAVFTR